MGKNNYEWIKVANPSGLNDEVGLDYFLTCYFNSALDRYLISISPNVATTKSVTTLKENYKFQFKSDLCFIFRFENRAELNIKYNEGAKVPIIIINFDTINIHCSLVGISTVNRNKTSDTIWNFALKTESEMLICKIHIER